VRGFLLLRITLLLGSYAIVTVIGCRNGIYHNLPLQSLKQVIIGEILSMNTAEIKKRFLLSVKIGIVKQLYKDQLITANQYQYLMIKYMTRADDPR